MDDDNSLADGEPKDSTEPLSPILGGKKFKLNDGSSQHSSQKTVSSSSKDENMESGVSAVKSESTTDDDKITSIVKNGWTTDLAACKAKTDGASQKIDPTAGITFPGREEIVDSGVSADKTESTSSNDNSASTSAGPSNEVVQIAASGSNVRAILLNIRQPNRCRNYRKRKTPEHDTDSSPSSRDSDDWSAPEPTTPPGAPPDENTISEPDAELQRLLELCSTDTDNSNNSSSSSSYDNESNGPVRMHSGETDTDEDPSAWSPTRANENEVSQSVDMKMPDIISREMGLTFPYGKTTKEDVMFSKRFYGSLHSVYRLKMLHRQLLVSGSDDTNIIVWDWARNRSYQTIKTGHKSNVFQSKFLHLNAQSQLNIVTRTPCCRPARTASSCTPTCAPTKSPSTITTICYNLYAHKLHVSAAEPHAVLSAGEDGVVMLADVGTDQKAKAKVRLTLTHLTCAIYNHNGKEILGSYNDEDIYLFDVLKDARLTLTHLTCAIYNHNGKEILGSYNDEDIYLFDVLKDVYDKDKCLSIDGYSKRYSGHRNSATFKGVAFFGPNSEYVVSGSDCSYIYMWSTSHESIVQWIQGDISGVVSTYYCNSATFKGVAFFGPNSEYVVSGSDCSYIYMWSTSHESIVQWIQGDISGIRSPLFNDFLPSLYTAWRNENRLVGDPETPPSFGGNIEFDGNRYPKDISNSRDRNPPEIGYTLGHK
ncbi:putative Nuclear distribution protein nudF [Operophtera brumata]|uniref:Putative Nuclear distribution protein nudF n=1 Tax=Operophtera brumata TaxID=104452 RepID=A0A0L7LUU9_OPEBR|nr:putative Nuclear distribution protein nudF [Operophtera brumata]